MPGLIGATGLDFGGKKKVFRTARAASRMQKNDCIAQAHFYGLCHPALPELLLHLVRE